MFWRHNWWNIRNSYEFGRKEVIKNFTPRDGIRKKPSLVGSLDTYRNQSWACFEPPPRRKAATARAGPWLFVKLRFVRFKGRSSRGDWTPGLERKNIFIEKPSFIGSDRLWTSTIIKNQVSAIILRFCRATAGPWHSRHVLEQICWDFRLQPEMGGPHTLSDTRHVYCTCWYQWNWSGENVSCTRHPPMPFSYPPWDQ